MWCGSRTSRVERERKREGSEGMSIWVYPWKDLTWLSPPDGVVGILFSRLRKCIRTVYYMCVHTTTSDRVSFLAIFFCLLRMEVPKVQSAWRKVCLFFSSAYHMPFSFVHLTHAVFLNTRPYKCTIDMGRRIVIWMDNFISREENFLLKRRYNPGEEE